MELAVEKEDVKEVSDGDSNQESASEDGSGSSSEPEDSSESESEEEDNDDDSAGEGDEKDNDSNSEKKEEDAGEGEDEDEVVFKFPSPSKKKNSIGDMVFCRYGNDIFAAKVLKIEQRPMRRNEAALKAYFVHYQGWSKRFDAWVEEQYVYDYTDENKLIKKQLLETEKERKRREKEKADKQQMLYEQLVMENGNFKRGKRKKQKLKIPKSTISEDVKKARSYNRKVRFNSRKEMDLTEYIETFNLNLSLNLKKRAVQDWEMIALDKRLVCLPRKPCVRDILNDYLKLKQSQLDKISGTRIGDGTLVDTDISKGTKTAGGSNDTGTSEKAAGDAKPNPAKVYQELIYGIEQFFNRALGKCLLYRLERKQYDDYMSKNPGALPADVYGAEHLLRLFIRLPMFLSMSNDMDSQKDGSKKIQAYLQSFLQYLGSNLSNKYFGTVYEKPDEEYMKQFLQQPVMSAVSKVGEGSSHSFIGESGKLEKINANDNSNSELNKSRSRHSRNEEAQLMERLLKPAKKKARKK